jgi:dUTP pyrophosphatase
MGSNQVQISIVFLPNYNGPETGPAYGTEFAGAFDFNAAIDAPIHISPGQSALIPTGIAIALPTDKMLLIAPRSGLAAKHQVGVGNAPGVIDADYRGEIKVILQNLGDDLYTVEPGDRVAQGTIVDFYQAVWQVVEELNDTKRGSGGFGHTGK